MRSEIHVYFNPLFSGNNPLIQLSTFFNCFKTNYIHIWTLSLRLAATPRHASTRKTTVTTQTLSCAVVEHVWNLMAHAQKPDLVFQRNVRVHLKLGWGGGQFRRLLAAEVCTSAVVMVECKTTGYPLHSHVSLSLPLPCVAVCHQVSTELYRSIVWHWHAVDKVTLAHITHPQFFVHLRGEIGPIRTTFRESNLPQMRNKTCIFTRMYPKYSLLGFRTSWPSAMSTVVICLRILTKELNTPNYHYSTELNRLDSVKMGSYLCHTITNNLYITCEWQ